MRAIARRSLFLLTIAGLGAALTSCSSSGPAGVYGDFQWQVRCGAMGCSPPGPRNILGYDNEMGNDLNCQVRETDGNRVLSFSAFQRGFGISLSNASFTGGAQSPAG